MTLICRREHCPTASRGYAVSPASNNHPDDVPGTLKPLLEDAGLSLTTVELARR